MKKLGNSLLVLLLCACFLFTAACSKNPSSDVDSGFTSDTAFTESEITDSQLEDQADDTTNSSTSTTTSNKSSQAASTGSTASEPGRTNSANGKVLKDIKIASGTKKMDSGLNFGGKKLTMLIWSEVYDDSMKQMIAAYEKQFNCTVDVSTTPFSNYLTAISNSITNGKPYDIVRMHGSLYPRSIISNLLEPMESGFTTADLVKSGNTAAGGIDLEKSKYFAWGNKLYAVCEREAAPLQIMLYNKLKFKDDLGVDPLDLYKKGQWTWDKIKELGQKVTKPENNVYFGDYTFVSTKVFAQANDAHVIKNVNGVLKENLLDANMFNALKYIQSISQGKNSILTSQGSADNFTLMKDGTTYMFCTETAKISLFAEQAAKSQAFGKNANNMGVVPLPLGPDNKTGAYPANWLVGFSACRTKDVTPAIAMLKFSSTWEGSSSSYKMDSYVAAQLDKFYDNINYCDYGFSTADTKLDTVMANIENRVYMGEDITKVLKEKQSIVQGVIDSCLDYQ